MLSIAFSKKKLEGLDNLQAFQKVAENATGKKIRKIHSDRSSEFHNSRGKRYFQQQGIVHERSAAYTQHQNGMVERHVQTIVGKTRSMMFTAGAPANLWHYRAIHAVHIHNRLPSRFHRHRLTPYEIYNGTRPKYSRFRVWGCDAYVLDNRQKTKFATRTQTHAVIGIEGDSPNYILINPVTGNITISRNVYFNESSFTAMETISKKAALGLQLGKGTNIPPCCECTACPHMFIPFLLS